MSAADTGTPDPDTGDPGDPDAPGDFDGLDGGPQIGIRAPVGTGKTERVIAEIRALLDASSAARVAVFVPDHALAAEMVERLRRGLGSAFPVAVWRGQEQPDPATRGETMCRRVAEVRELRKLGGEAADLCGSQKRGLCRSHPNCPVGTAPCGYRGQWSEVRAAKAVVLTHASLPHAPPEPMRRRVVLPDGTKAEVPPADLVVVDESFWQAMLGGSGPKPVAVPLDDLGPAHFAGVPAAAGAWEPAGWAAGRVQAAVGALRRAAAAAGAGASLSREALKAAGLMCAHDAREARDFVFRLKQDVARALGGHVPTGDAEKDAAGIMAVLGAIGPGNRRVLGVARALRIAAGVLSGRYGPGALRVGAQDGAPALLLRWREDIHHAWLAAPQGVVHLDATMESDLVRVWLPKLSVPQSAPVATPFMRVAQVSDRGVGHTALLEAKNQGANGQRAARNNAARVQRVIERLARRHAGRGAAGGSDVLAVLPKELERALRPTLPDNAGTLHFGKLRGQDAFRGVAAALVVSRTMPAPRDVEDTAEIVFGGEVQRLPAGAFYPRVPVVRVMADGTGQTAAVHRHPDHRAEAVRRALCEAELVQAVGRVRGSRRTAADPVDVWILTNVPLGADVRPDRTLPLAEAWKEWGGLDAATALLEAGVVPKDWAGRGAILAAAGLLPRAKAVGPAARDLFRRTPGAAGRLRDALGDRPGSGTITAKGCAPTANSAGTSLKISYGGSRAIPAPTANAAGGSPPQARPVWSAYRYRRAGERKGGVVHVADFHSDPRAAVEKALGPLDRFAPFTSGSAPRPARPKSSQASAPSVSLAHQAAPARTAPFAPRLPTAPTTAGAAGSSRTDVPVRLPDVIRAAGRTMPAFRGFLLTTAARRLGKVLAAQGIRPELRHAAAARAWIGSECFDAALRLLERSG